jgi:hypothetical protein
VTGRRAVAAAVLALVATAGLSGCGWRNQGAGQSAVRSNRQPAGRSAVQDAGQPAGQSGIDPAVVVAVERAADQADGFLDSTDVQLAQDG